ncbi:type II toxin-antitoxin system ChpB family toxin [Sansalvadorimonas verongulae]|uniref:type II toxin-antitoxin system ChpB family toxin n=1 Tax=Sansalvadorimonas verongulae TaxID=2172824 RepID=UPI0012BCD3D9|nr:type II toxin-antitoxin system ChpB family toxin [Sansalvadorimonas verongulae]MTI11961.1 type II toxin-antitoxin system ChpB family toxin [Sansalvadorimonas verongulae]
MVKAVFDRGDIVKVCLNPTEGRELQGDYRPCLVLSPRKFNRLGMTLIAPITQGGEFARVKGFTLPLSGTGTETQGVVLLNAVRMVDLAARDAQKKEAAPEFIVQEAVAILNAIIE